MEKYHIYKLNANASKKAYEHLKLLDRVHMKECYNNTFNLLITNQPKFFGMQWRVAYGYVETVNGLWVRHCFAIDSRNKIIDPTYYTHEIGKPTDRRYLIFKIYDDPQEYVDAVKANGNYPSLDYPHYPLIEIEKEYRAGAIQQYCFAG